MPFRQALRWAIIAIIAVRSLGRLLIPLTLATVSLFPPNLPRLLIITQSRKTSVPQVRVRRPFRELDLGDKLRLQPAALFHLTRRQRPHGPALFG